MATQIDLAKGIDSLTSFKRNTPAFLDRLRASGQPLVLTINGKAEVVVQNAGAYQQLLERLEAVEASSKGAATEGQMRPAGEGSKRDW